MSGRSEPISPQDALRDHTLSERYFLGYTASRRLFTDIESVVIDTEQLDTDRCIYYRNHNIRATVRDGTKRVEVPTPQLAKQIERIHRRLARSDAYQDIRIENRVGGGDALYDTADRLIGDEVSAFFDRLRPAGPVVICRPEELLGDLLADHLGRSNDYIDDFVESSRSYIERIDDESATWESVREPRSQIHPKFARIHELADELRAEPDIELRLATGLSGSLRGYRLSLDGQPLTLLSRGWGRDMGFVMTKRLIDEYPVDCVLFLCGCGAIQPEMEINDLVCPTTFTAPDEPTVTVENVFCDDPELVSVVPHVGTTAVNVDSLVEETTEFMTDLRAQGITSISMENYGVAKALSGTDVPFGALSFVMDVPLAGQDLGSTNYHPTNRKQLAVVGNTQSSRLSLRYLGLSDVSVESIMD